ncbi:PrsW family glutamic-type intramembrane protease [Verrucomicrobiota bacterium sgz303538]
MSNIVAETITHEKEIDGFWVRLYFLSRDPAVLFGVAGGILILAVLVAWLLRAPDRPDNGPKDLLGAVRQELSVNEPDLARLLPLLPKLSERPTDMKEFPELLEKSHLIPAQREVVTAYWQSLLTSTGDSTAELIWAAHRFPPVPYANEMVADLDAGAGEIDRAANYYQREVQFFGTDSARAKRVELLLLNKRYAQLYQLRNVEGYARYFTPMVRLRLELDRRDWRAVVKALTDLEMARIQPMPVILALAAAMAWFALGLQAIQPQGWFSFRTVGAVLAIVAGLAATGAACFVGIWVEEAWGLRLTGDFINDIAYYFGSVAPREELVKLLFTLPFMPTLLRRGSRLEALVVSGCVGLGFATEGLLQAFQSVGPADSFGRFLTANFFHFAATGMCGLALRDFLESPRRQALPLFAVLVSVVLAHGIYDSFMAVRNLRILSIASIVSFLTLSLVWVHQLKQLRDGTTDQLSLSATLLSGISVLTGAMIICASTQLGFTSAVTSLSANAVGLVTIVCFFCHQFTQRITVEIDDTEQTIIVP